MEVSTEAAPLYEWTITVVEYNIYNEVVRETPMVVYAITKAEVTEKVLQAFGAKYDDFRRFWSHGWTLTSVREMPPSDVGEE